MPHVWPGVLAGGAAALAALLAWATREPFIFPSLGATAYLCATAPRSPAARPNAVFVSHLVAVIVGIAMLRLSGLDSHDPVAVEGMTASRVGVVSLSLAVTVVITSAVSTLHPPAGATNLIVTLGILSTPTQVLVLMGSVAVFTVLLMAARRRWRVAPAMAPSPVPADAHAAPGEAPAGGQ